MNESERKKEKRIKRNEDNLRDLQNNIKCQNIQIIGVLEEEDKEKTLESPLDCKEVQPAHPKGDQSWVFIGGTDVEAETPILWPPDVES